MGRQDLASAVSIEHTVPRWIFWGISFCFSYAVGTELMRFYCAASFIGMIVIAVVTGTFLGVVAGLIAHRVQASGVVVWPASLRAGVDRAALSGFVLAIIVHLIVR